MMSGGIDQRSVLIERNICNLDDLYSIISLVEEKLKETSKLVLLLLDSDYKPNLSNHQNLYYPEQKVDQFLDVKIEDLNENEEHIKDVKSELIGDSNILNEEDLLPMMIPIKNNSFELPDLICDKDSDFDPEELSFAKSIKLKKKVKSKKKVSKEGKGSLVETK